MVKVYLAGPIAGLTHKEALSWREVATDRLWPELDCLNPLRDKAIPGTIGTTEYRESVLTTDRGIVTRDMLDVRRADVILFNTFGWNRLSVGSLVELGWATAWHKPVVLIRDQATWTDHPLNHPFVRQLVDYFVDDLPAACEVIQSLFNLS